jgi:hypothetical protein
VGLTLSRVRLGLGMGPTDPCIGGVPSSAGLNCFKQDGRIITEILTIRSLQNQPG